MGGCLEDDMERNPLLSLLRIHRLLACNHRKRCFAIVLNDFYGMMLIKTMNRLSSGCERESAVFTFFSPSFITKSGKTKQNTQPLSLLQLVKTKAVQIELRSDLEESFSVARYFSTGLI